MSIFAVNKTAKFDRSENNSDDSLMNNKNNKITVLYVEDNAENIKLMRHIFEGLFSSVELLIAITGEEGLEVINKIQPDLILMDIDLPGIDGITALRQIKSNDQLKMPVIAISAYATQAQINKGMNAGFDEYITKPLNVSKLKETISRYMEKIRATT
ncbi:MAG: response regulator [Gammaproteobacteria bacterium]|nr:response regulator [Gammaproteobacteria bacterium]